jgi:hypothetical protein
MPSDSTKGEPPLHGQTTVASPWRKAAETGHQGNSDDKQRLANDEARAAERQDVLGNGDSGPTGAEVEASESAASTSAEASLGTLVPGTLGGIPGARPDDDAPPLTRPAEPSP